MNSDSVFNEKSRPLQPPLDPLSSRLVPTMPSASLGIKGAACGVFLLVGLVQASVVAAGDSPVSFNRDVRPILTDNCFACHGPDSNAREADLRLDVREDAVNAGAWVPGDPDASEAILRILEQDDGLRMPPPESHKELVAEQKETLIRWVEEGAEYEPHWSLITPARPALPAVQDESWVRVPFDRFVLRQLESQGLQPAPEADRYTLGRRAALDVTGLPPTPEMLLAFVNDSRPDAYEHYLDELFRSTRWGEHRARYWLDAARYADTHGLHFDNYRETWAYRDWVIRAFNENMPFDQFTIESIAGDLLPTPTMDQLVGSGFNRCNITTNEGGIIDEEYLVLYTRDRTETVAKIWMGLTANCSVCHDHKFDPISQREFYEMAAFFNNTTQAAKDGNIKDTPPTIPVPRNEDRERWFALEQRLPEFRDALDQQRQASLEQYNVWLAEATPDSIEEFRPEKAPLLEAPLTRSDAAKEDAAEAGEVELVVRVADQERRIVVNQTAQWVAGRGDAQALQPNGVAAEISEFGDFDQDQPYTVSAWVRLPNNDRASAVIAKMDTSNAYRGWDVWIQQRRLGMHLINQWPENALKVVAKNQIPAGQWTHVTVSYDGSSKSSGVKVYYNGEQQATNVEQDSLNATTRNDVPFRIGQRSVGGELRQTAMELLHVYDSQLTSDEVRSLATHARLGDLLAEDASQRTADQQRQLHDWWLSTHDPEYQSLAKQLRDAESEHETIRRRGTIAHVMNENRQTDPLAYVLYRGEYDQRRDQVSADTFDCLPPFPEESSRDRLGFAHWLLQDDQPLTARVTVNRYWQEVFGQGIVPTAGDFGITGMLPTHPELLDWLAVEFRETDWDVKRFYRQLLLSATYRQSAQSSAKKEEMDPDNVWLSRGPRFRLDAEAVRDYVLASSGLLSSQIGGPSVKPYQPPGVWEAVAMIGSNTRNYREDSGEALYRRSMYTFWKRSAPPASMEILNAPSREYCVVQRERTNTPLQALVTLNDPQFVEAARYLAADCLKQSADAREFIRLVAVRILCRELEDEELALLVDTYQYYLDYYQQHADEAERLMQVGQKPAPTDKPAPQVAAATVISNLLYNLDECLNK